MKRIRILFIGLALSAGVANTQAQVDQPGRLLASNCFQCHGTNGRGPGFFVIAGKPVGQIYTKLKSSQQRDGIMSKQALGFTDLQIQALDRWLATQ